MKRTLSYLIFLCAILFSEIILPQNFVGPDTAAIKRYVQKSGTNNPVLSDFTFNNSLVPIGKNGSILYRSFYQWNIPDSKIPDNAIIDTVEIFFIYRPQVSDYYISLVYSNIGIDLQSPSASTLWDRSMSSTYFIGSGYGNKYGFRGTSYDTVKTIFTQSSDFNNAVEASLVDDKFILGLAALTENFEYQWLISNYSVTMRIVWSYPQQLVTVEQKLSNNSNIDSIGLWDNSQEIFNKFSVPQTFSWDISSSKTLQGSQKIVSNQKYLHWENNTEADSNVVNHKTFLIYSITSNLTSRFEPTNSGITIRNILEGGLVSGGTVQFKDPWLIDYADSLFGNIKRNRGNDAVLKSRTSPFYPDYTTSYNGDVYKGIFLNQNPNYLPNIPAYSVKAESQNIYLSETGKTHLFQFQNWSGDSVAFQNPTYPQTAVVFTNANAIAKANYKGTQLSDNSDAYKLNNQRKFIKAYGKLFNVYESMGDIWLEQSVDSGRTWSIYNTLHSGKRLNEFAAHSPSIDFLPNGDSPGDLLVVTFVEKEISGVYEYPRIVTVLVGTKTAIFKKEIVSYLGKPWGTEYSPVVAAHGTNKVLYIWKDYDHDTEDEGLVYRQGTVNAGSTPAITWKQTGDLHILSGTDERAYTPSLCVTKSASTRIYHLVWEERNATTSGIKYLRMTADGSDNLSFSSVLSASSGSSYDRNSKPSVSSMIQSSYDVPKILWVGTRSIAQDKISLNKEQSLTEYKAVFRDYNGSWSPFFIFGNSNVESVNINTTDNSNYVISWSSTDLINYQNYYVRNTNFSNIKNFLTDGKQFQINNGADFNSIYANSFKTSTTPKYFTVSSSSVGQIGKESFITALSGRQAIISKNGYDFFYTVSDVNVNEDKIEFIEAEEELTIGNLGELNNYLVSEPFELNDNSSFSFSLGYGSIKNDLNASSLGEEDQITYRLELIDNVTKEVLGIFSEIDYTQANFPTNSHAYNVDTEGINNRTVRLRIVAECNNEAQYELATLYSTEEIIGKSNIEQIGYKGELTVTDYELAQNYPNPFNPLTTIKFAIPEDGMVSLKIYDVLGKEVTSIINDYKTKGYHEVRFDASELASGVYLYQIKVNDFNATKKMMLLK